MTSVVLEDSVFLTNVNNNQSRTSSHEKTLVKITTKKPPRPDSPTTLQACQQLGILPTELKQKTIDDFRDPMVEEEIVQIRFRHYLKRYNQTMKDVAAARRKIARKMKSQQFQQLEQQQAPTETSGNIMLNSYYVNSFRMPNVSTSPLKTPLSPLANYLATSMSQNFNKTLSYFRSAHDNGEVRSADQIIGIDESQVQSPKNPSEKLNKTLSQAVFQFNRAKQQKQKEANEIYCQEIKRVEMLKEIEERKKKEQEKHKMMIMERKKKETEKKKQRAEKAEKIKEYERNYHYKKEEEKEKLDKKLEEARKNFQEENEERNRKIAEREQKLEMRRKVVHERKEKIDEEEVKMADQLKMEIEDKFLNTEENYNLNLFERSLKLRTRNTKVEESVEKIKEKYRQESKEHVQKLIEKMVQQDQTMKEIKTKHVKEFKLRETATSTKGQKFFSNQGRLEEKERQRMDDINERSRKIQEHLEIKKETDEKNRKLQQEILRLKHQDKIDNHDRIQRQLQNDRLRIFDKEKQIQERIFWLNAQKEMALQAKIEMSIQTKLERERIDDAVNLITRGINGPEPASAKSNKGQRKLLKDILQPHDFRAIEEKERKKKFPNNSQNDQEITNASLKPLNSTKKIH